MAHEHALRALCLALAGSGLLPALAQETPASATEARRALGLETATAPGPAALPASWALGLQAASAPAVEQRVARAMTARAALALADGEAPLAAQDEPQQDDAPALAGAPDGVERWAAMAPVAPAATPLPHAQPATSLPPLAPVPDAPMPAPEDLRFTPLLVETRVTLAPLLAAVPFIDAPPGDGESGGSGDAEVRVASADASETAQADAGPAAAPEHDATPLPGHEPATAHAVAQAAVEFEALHATLASEPAQALPEHASVHAERVLAALAEVSGLHDAQPLLRELPLPPSAPLSAVERVLADLAEVTERWQIAQEVLDDLRPNTMGEGWERVARAELDGTRGGFLTPNGLRVSFGIERAVYINGNLVATTRLTVSELGAVSGTGASISGSPGFSLIQNGALGTVTGAIAPGSVGTVIQNALNGQQIQNTTTINATVNSLDVMRSINLQSTIRNAVTDSLRR